MPRPVPRPPGARPLPRGPGRALLAQAAAGLVAAALMFAAPLAAREPDGVAFREEFDAPLDPARWFVSDGWSNGDWQGCTWSARMLAISEGVLRMSLAPTQAGSDEWLCGELQSNAFYGYGTFEARLRTDRASGVNAALFTYTGPTHGDPHEEIDVEVLTRDPGRFDVNTYSDGVPNYGTTVPLPVPADAGFLTYSFVWEPGRIRWYVDGALVHEASGDLVPTRPQKIFLSHWNSRTLTDWMGPWENPGRPLAMAAEWVAYTPLGAGCLHEGSVLCEPGFEP